MSTTEEVLIPADGGIQLAARIHLPEGAGPHPAITMANGFGGIKEQGLGPFADLFADSGYVVIVHDHRNFGGSGGEVRGDVNPWEQIADWRRVISYLETRPEVDSDRIGMWATSYAGGHALVLGATDRRLKAIVANVPVTDGITNGQRRVSPTAVPDLEHEFDEDERGQLAGRPPVTRALVSSDPDEPAFYRDPAAVAYYLREPERGATFVNTATLRSLRWTRMYAPGAWAPAVSPTPLLMIVAKDDRTSGTQLALSTYESALEPKSLTLIDGDHFAPYLSGFPITSKASLDWFDTHLA